MCIRDRSIDRILRMSASTPGQWEYGFTAHVPDSGPITVWPVGTSREHNGIIVEDLWPFVLGLKIAPVNLLVHNHNNDTSLSQDDTDTADRLKMSVIAVTRKGKKYCYR